MVFTLNLQQFPQYSINIYKYVEIKNISKVKEQLLAGNSQYDYAFINPKTIVSLEQLSSAIYRALLDYDSQNAKTKSIHSEVVFDLGRGNKIGENLIKFGINEEINELIIVKVSDSTVESNLSDIIEGTEKEVTEEEFNTSCDLALLKQIYNIESDSKDINHLTRLIVNSIQLRGH